jgi:Flp pilus assembly CpaE family ATPase
MTAGYMDMNDLTSAGRIKFMREGFKKIGMTDEQAGETVNMIVKTTAEKSAELLDYCFDELEKAPEMVRNGIFLNWHLIC